MNLYQSNLEFCPEVAEDGNVPAAGSAEDWLVDITGGVSGTTVVASLSVAKKTFKKKNYNYNFFLLMLETLQGIVWLYWENNFKTY